MAASAAPTASSGDSTSSKVTTNRRHSLICERAGACAVIVSTALIRLEFVIKEGRRDAGGHPLIDDRAKADIVRHHLEPGRVFLQRKAVAHQDVASNDRRDQQPAR